ncbi:Uncharacterised protein [Vibrio cholerae]|uniref:Uncharacterized protein n=1 Tax=Vibrio cholerae TaxID=666 RepID=A0A655WSL2_VIBCL|nr:Uncharacterised protein [Vibrio cholerae]
MVVTRSCAETPVVTPCLASIDTVNAVWFALLLLTTIGGRAKRSACASVRHKQTMPLHSRIINAICAVVRDSTA